MGEIKNVLDFWFGHIVEDAEYLASRSALWFGKSEIVDGEIRRRWKSTHAELVRDSAHEWQGTPTGRLAAVIVLDQFSRNMYRGDATAFASDGLALKLVEEGMSAGVDRVLHPVQRSVFYLPLQHSENLSIQRQSVAAYAKLVHDSPRPLKDGFAENLDFAIRHLEIIEKFGRFPHRNAVLGRPSTAAETEFLKGPGSSF